MCQSFFFFIAVNVRESRNPLCRVRITCWFGELLVARKGGLEGVLKYSYRGLPCDVEPGRADTNNRSVDSIFEFKPPARGLG